MHIVQNANYVTERLYGLSLQLTQMIYLFSTEKLFYNVCLLLKSALHMYEHYYTKKNLFFYNTNRSLTISSRILWSINLTLKTSLQ
jgi:hypothetical protein